MSSATVTSLVSFLNFALFLVVWCYLTTSSLLVFFIIFEFSLFPVCLIILLLGYQPEKIKSMFYILLYTFVWCNIEAGFIWSASTSASDYFYFFYFCLPHLIGGCNLLHYLLSELRHEVPGSLFFSSAYRSNYSRGT